MLNGLDLFSGIGGLTLALGEWVRPVAYCEIEPYAVGVLFSRMLDGAIPKAPIFPDVTKIRGAILPGIDIIYGGFPCQDVSTAGLRKGMEGGRTVLYREAIRLVRECKPLFVFLENVPGIRIYVPEIRGELEAIGYDCRDGFLSAAEVGANHIRNRWWLLAHANNDGCNELHESESQCEQGREDTTDTFDHGAQESLADSESLGCERPRGARNGLGLSQYRSKEYADTDGQQTQWPTEPRPECHSWTTEPDVGRVVNGLPMRVDRIKGLGNSVVPQCAKEAFKRLMGII